MKITRLAAAALAVSVAAPALADPPQATGFMYVGSRFYTVVTQYDGVDAYENTQTYTGPNGFSSASVSVPHGLVEVHGSGIACPLCTGGGQSLAQVKYSFVVGGDGPYSYVPLLVTYRLAVTTTDFGSAGAIIAINSPHTPTDYPISGFSDYIIGQYDFTADVTRTTTFYAGLNTWNQLLLQADGVSSNAVASGSYMAEVDPFIRIDPDFLRANPGYTLSFSVGANDGAPGGTGMVPEPATWALLLAGFGLTGTALRRRGSAVSKA